jgi:basic membrane lipoprotein Med (substrate-binding protein (PBP1-ABC) superfamily)
MSNLLQARLGATWSLILIALGLQCGCRQEPMTSPDRFKVRALIHNLPHDMEEGAGRGLALIAADLDADVALIAEPDDQQRRMILRELGDEGVDLVFCLGDVYQAAVYTEARAYPETSFVIRPGSPDDHNVASLSFLVEEPAFLAGVLADLVRQSRQKVGAIVGSGGPWLERVDEGFIAGLRSQGSDDELIRSDGPDGPWALAAQGVAIALYAADTADPAVLAAAHDAGVQLIVTDTRALRSEADVVLAAVTIDVGTAMLSVARDVANSSFQSRDYTFGLGSGVIDLKLSPSIDRQTARAIRQVLENSRTAITAGWVEVEQLGL